MANDSSWDVVVVGGANSDYLVRGKHLPSPGETVEGDLFLEGPGGKGANQAVAASRLGARVAFIGKVGDDARGDTLLAALMAENVDVSNVRRSAERATGVALVMVGGDGQKQILAMPGANHDLTVDDIEAAREMIASARVLLAQLEVDPACTLAAARIVRDHGGSVVLDPAPARPIPGELYSLLSIIRPNATEAETLTGIEVRDRASARRAAAELMRRGAKGAIVQAGDEGNLLVTSDGELFLPKLPVESVDATGAGDAFAAAMAVMLAERSPIEEAARFANAAAALATTRFGAQPGLPRREEVLALLGKVNDG